MIDIESLSPEMLEAVRAMHKAGIHTPTAMLTATKASLLNVVEHGETFFYIPETGKPIIYEPFQKIILNIIAGTHNYPTLLPFYSTVEYSTVKKSGKTAVSGAYARWRTEQATLSDEILFFANDETQSRGRAYEAIDKSIRLSPFYDPQKRILYDEFGNPVWRIIEDYLEHIPTMTKVKAVNVDYRGEAGSNPTLTVWCVDQETELLTDNGWITYDKFDLNCKVATRNPVTGAFEWQTPKAVNITPFKGEMYVTHGKQIDMSVTPNHRLWGCTTSYASRSAIGRMDFLHIEEAVKHTCTWIPDAFTSWQPNNLEDVEPETGLNIRADLYAEFMGWFLSEGTCHKNEAVLISQSGKANPDKCNEICSLIMEMGFSPGEWMRDGETSTLVIYSSTLNAYCKQFGTQDKRYIPKWLKESKYLRTFFLSYLAGDGHDEVSANRLKIGTISKQMSSDLQETGLKLGYWVSTGTYKDPRSDFLQYTVRFYDGEQGTHAWGIRKHAWDTEEYDGIVWCPSTENGIVVVRRNGKIYQTGNTECWGYDTKKQEILFDEMTPVLTRERSQRYLEGYAGYTGKSLVQEKVEKLLTDPDKGGRQLTIDDIPDWPWQDEEKLPLYTNDTAGMFAYLDRGPGARRRMPWLTGERGDRYYAEQALTLHDPLQFDRLHNNYWISPVTAFIPIEWWKSCLDASLQDILPWRMPTRILQCPDIDAVDEQGVPLINQYVDPTNWQIVGEPVPVVLGCDASVVGDCTALVMCARHPIRHTECVMYAAFKWDPPRGSKIDYDITPNPFTGLSLTQQVIDMCMRYNVVEFAYDEWQLHHLTNQLRRDAIVWCRAFKQGVERDISDKQLYDLIKTKKVTYPLNSENICYRDMEHHIQGASRTMKPREDTKLHITKSSDESKIDLVVALSMASAEVLRLDL